MSAVEEYRSMELGVPGIGPARRIGGGGFADVYLAEQVNLRRQVAVKIARGLASDSRMRIRFERECQALGKVSDHSNIVSVYDGGFTEDDQAYLVMEYMSGGSLAERLTNSEAFPISEIVEIGVSIASALDTAHQAGVLHRDVKPGNILISSVGKKALADFGIARIEGGEQTTTGHLTASLAHAAPEVLERGRPGPESDVYSLASTLYQLAAGRPAFMDPRDESVFPLINRILTQPLADPVNVGFPDEVARVIARAMEKSPEERIGSALELGDALQVAVSVDGPKVDLEAAGVTRNMVKTVVQEQRPMLQDSASVEVGSPGETLPFHPKSTQPVKPIAAPRPQPAQPVHVSPPVQPSQTPPESRKARKTKAPKRRRGRILTWGRWLLILLGLFMVGLIASLILRGLENAEVGGSQFAEFTESATEALKLETVNDVEGPVVPGEKYPVAVEGLIEGEDIILTLNGTPMAPQNVESASFVAAEGLIEIEADILGSEADVEPLLVYGRSPVTDTGFRANLSSISSDVGWGNVLDQLKRFEADGHQNLTVARTEELDGPKPGFWIIFKPGFGKEGDAEVYCESYGLRTPDECYSAPVVPAGN